MFRPLFSAVAGAAVLCASATAGELWVSIDTMTRYQMPDRVGQIVLTNPSVADVQVTSATEMSFFGKMPGFTDVVFQTADGERLGEMRVRVGNVQAGLVTLYNGAERYSFSCTHRCEQTMVVGDGQLGDASRLVAQARMKATAGATEGGLDEQAFGVTAPSQGQREAAASDGPSS